MLNSFTNKVKKTLQNLGNINQKKRFTMKKNKERENIQENQAIECERPQEQEALQEIKEVKGAIVDVIAEFEKELVALHELFKALDTYTTNTEDDIREKISEIEKKVEEIEEFAHYSEKNNIFLQQYLQKEILLWGRDLEVCSRFQQLWLKYSWFTKLFDRKMMAVDYENIRKDVYKEYAEKIKSFDDFFVDAHKKKQEKEKEGAKQNNDQS